jgi:hypothetical protein
MRNALHKFIFPLFLTGVLSAQMPDTDLWLFKLKKDKEGKISVADPVNVTNRKGYDNQPSFSPDGKKIYYSRHEGEQTDIYTYDLKKKKIEPLTSSPESEYSATFTPDEKFICSVVVQQDSSQKIHYINPLTGAHEKNLGFDSVGYYTFLNKDTLIYYKLTSPHSLRMYSIVSNEDRWIADSPARTFKPVSRHEIIYGIKDSLEVKVYRYNFLLQKGKLFTVNPPGGEDMIWHPEWHLLRSDGATIKRFDEKMNEWMLLLDLSQYGIKKITRFAIDPKNKHIVVVDNI